MAPKINILEGLGGSAKPDLERVKLDENETALVLFTTEGESAAVHYCDEHEIRGYVLCAEDRCILCRIGRKREDRRLLPVYLPTSYQVAVLSIGTSLRPNALLPQIASILQAEKPLVAFVTRHGPKFTVSTSELPEDADAGELTIQEFLEHADNVELTSIFQRLDNSQLASVPGIAEMARLKGIKL